MKLLKEIQKRATKQVKQIRHLSYSEQLKRLNLPTLRYRRHRGDMLEVYKILHDIYDKETTTGILNLSRNTSTRGHSLKLTTQRSRLELRRNSLLFCSQSCETMEFFPRSGNISQRQSVRIKTGQDVEPANEVQLQRRALPLMEGSGQRGQRPTSSIHR